MLGGKLMSSIRLVRAVATFKERVRDFIVDHPQLISNVLFIYVSYALRFLSPLVVVPLLARRLGPSGYGLVQLGTALGLFITLVVEFGFPASGPRDIATAPSPKELASVFSAISAAKLMMILPAVMIGIIATLTVPELREAPIYAVGGTLVGIAAAANLTWFWQGRGRMRVSTALDLAASLCYAIAVILFVRNAQLGYMALYCQAGSFFLSSAIAHILAARSITPRLPTKEQIGATLKGAVALFLARAAGAVYTTASVLVLGILSTITEVSYYAAGEKIVLLVMSATYPLGQAVFPHVVRQMAVSRAKALGLIRFILAALVGGTALASLIFCLFAPQFIVMLYGHRFSGAVASFRVLVWAIPISAAAQVLNNQLLVPSRYDGWVTSAVLIGGIANLVSAVVLAPRFGGVGMAISRVFSEAVVLVTVLEVVRRKRLMMD